MRMQTNNSAQIAVQYVAKSVSGQLYNRVLLQLRPIDKLPSWLGKMPGIIQKSHIGPIKYRAWYFKAVWCQLSTWPVLEI